MALAEIGVFTGLAETAATAIGAGIVIGGFVAGGIGAVSGWDRAELDRRVPLAGYLGGLFVVALGLLDLVLRYGG